MNLTYSGFRKGCRHRVRLLPVIDFSYAYGCLHCRGYLRAAYSQEMAGKSFRDAAAVPVERLAEILGEPVELVPVTVRMSDAEFSRACESLGLVWPEYCPYGCGCQLGTDDADRRDCACDGPCCYECRENGYPDLPSWREMSRFAKEARPGHSQGPA